MDPAEYLDRVQRQLPAIRDRAAQCEELRRVPDERMKALRQAGILRGLQPARYGGYELDPWTFFQAGMQISTVCPSTGWVLGVVGVHSWQLGLFPEQAQEEVWGDDTDVLISSSYAPTGKVAVVDGGFRVSGRWSFSSGCDHCDWVFLGGLVKNDAGPPDMRTFLIPRSDYQIDDNWRVAGLCGTGSKDIVVEHAFVPEHRTHRMIDAITINSPGQAVNTSALFRIPFPSLFSNAIAVPAIGAALGALDCYRTQTRERYDSFDHAKVAEDPFAQVRLAEATAEVDAARERLERVWTELQGLVYGGQPVSMELRRRLRFDGTQAVARSIRAVDLVFEASGGRGIFLDNPIQRFFRDVHAMRAHHINNPDKGARMFGRQELLPDAPPLDPFA